MKKINLNIITGYIVLLIIAVGTSVIGVYIVKKIQTQVVQEEKPSQYPDYFAIKGKNPDPKIKQVMITEDCPRDGCVNDKPATVDFDGIKKRYKVKGRFARAYLYIEAKVDYNRPLTVWDDVYFRINGLGGHLIPNDNVLPVPPAEFSSYLYDLRSISYFSTLKDKEKRVTKQTNINLFVLLQNGINLNIITSISSDRPGRVMKEVSIYYECFEGSDCSITEIK